MSIETARLLRQQSTEAEERLWNLLRDRQLQNYRFRRQHPIGQFIADFACTKYRLIIEADSGQHADNPDDAKRTAWLEKQGWKVVRFWNNDILANTDGVLWSIVEVVEKLEKDRAINIPSQTRQCAIVDRI